MTSKLTIRMGEVTYVIAVLWMAGWSVKSIALATDKLRGSVKGIAQRRFPKSREEMTLEERQAILDQLKATRLDGGLLSEGHFRAVELRAVQQRKQRVAEARSAQSKLLSSRKARQAAEDAGKVDKPMTLQQRRKAERKAREEDEHRRRQRESGLAAKRGDAGSALEYLANRQILTDFEDRRSEAFKKDIGSSGRRRLEAGLKLRQYFAGARIGGLKAVDVEMAGGGSAIGMPPTAHRLHCMDSLGLIRSMMPVNDFQMIEAVVDQDDFPWERATVTIEPGTDPADNDKRRAYALDRARGVIYDDIRRTLDIIAVYESLLTYEGFTARWGWHLIKTPRADRYRAMDAADEATQLLESAGRSV